MALRLLAAHPLATGPCGSVDADLPSEPLERGHTRAAQPCGSLGACGGLKPFGRRSEPARPTARPDGFSAPRTLSMAETPGLISLVGAAGTGGIGLLKVPRIWMSPRVRSPAVTGLFRPVPLLPADLEESLSPEETRLVLKHELTHLQRGELASQRLAVSPAGVALVQSLALDRFLQIASGSRGGL